MYKNKEEKGYKKIRNNTENKTDDHSFSAFVKTKEEI
jgi:hypothetical protein